MSISRRVAARVKPENRKLRPRLIPIPRESGLGKENRDRRPKKFIRELGQRKSKNRKPGVT